jgi:hypothetical protein
MSTTPNLGLTFLTSGQLQPEVTVNSDLSILDSLLLGAAAFGNNPATTTGLTYGYFGASIYSNGANVALANGTVALTASATNYVQRTALGGVSVNTTGFTVGLIPMAQVVTGASSITSITDKRPSSADLRGRQVIQVGAPTGVGVATATTGGTLAAATYGYRVSAVYPWGESAASAEVTVTTTGTTSENTISWTLPSGATAAKVYGRTSGGELLIATVAAGTSSYLDTGSVTPSGALPTGSLTIGDAQVNTRILSFQGTLGGNTVVNFPTYQQEWIVSHDATASGFSLQAQATGSSAPVTLTQGVASVVYGNGVNLVATGSTGGGFANPMTTAGDLIYGGTSGAATRVGIGAAGQVLTVVSGLPAWANNPAGFANPMTTLGDLITGGTSGAAGRLGVGSAGRVLTVVSGAPAWAPLPSSAPPALPVNAQTGTAYTLAATDAPAANGYQGIVTMNNAAANTLTVPPNSSVAFPVGAQIQIVQLGAGQTAVAAGAGVTVSNPSSLTARAQYSTLVLTQVSANAWVLGGDMT